MNINYIEFIILLYFLRLYVRFVSKIAHISLMHIIMYYYVLILEIYRMLRTKQKYLQKY